ncbi:MAG: alpha-1,6-mannanase [Pedobacter sp.]|nr:MAG: alpha-1,6-mannanase [Pedobacter sp.]
MINYNPSIHLIKKLSMKRISLILLFIYATVLVSCKKDGVIALPEDTIGKTVKPVTKLKAVATSNEKELEISWTNPEDESIIKAELAYKPTTTGASASPNPLMINVTSGSESKLTIQVPATVKYTITVVVINKAGIKSAQTFADATPFSPAVADLAPIFLKRADTMMTSMVKLYLDGMPRDIWSASYPRASGYWDGAAVIWGHGGAFSGYAALKEAAEHYPAYKTKIASLYDNRLLKGIDDFRNTRNGRPEAYAVYPGDGDERYYDDNIWVGIDMVDLYMLTKSPVYLARAKIVWNFILAGTDARMGGGVYWKEDGNSKNTCSTAPAAVLAAKLYQATNETTYLNSAKSLYTWVKNTLQDPSDYLYWDNVHLSDESNPNSTLVISNEKYAYNAGQPMQIASLLYKITGEAHYLTEAQNIAKAAYKKWFIPFNSYTLGESFRILEPGHVWFQAIMFRGFIELYKQDGNATYVNAYKKTLANAWLSSARNKTTHLINSDFRGGGAAQTSYDILFQGACLEMLARLAVLEHEGL